MAQLTEWLKLMVAEINRKREDADRAREEEQARQHEVPKEPSKKEPPRKTAQARS